jgi:hypothetical protein
MFKISWINKLAIVLAAVSIFGLYSLVQAQDLSAVKYPIAELGSCQNQSACQVYCEQKDNMMACVSYGEQQGLISKQEAAIAKKALPRILEGKTPGGCKDKVSCESFCKGNVSALDECIGFAEEVGALPPEELAQAKKVAKALQSGANMPGGCKDKASCESYCAQPVNIDVCLDFASKAEMISPTELQEAKKVAKFLKSGQTPGKCQSKQACQAYCEADSNLEECLDFAAKAELISPEDLAIAKKTGGKGPGGCKGKEQCAGYCNQPDHAEECQNFAEKNGLLSAEQLQEMKGGLAKIKDGLDKIPPDAKAEVQNCLNKILDGNLEQVLSGSQKLTQNQGQQISGCFEGAMKDYAQKMMQQAQSGQAGQLPPGAGQGMPAWPGREQTGPEIKEGWDAKSAPPEMQADIQKQIQEQMEAAKQRAIEQNTPSDFPPAPPVGQLPPSGGVAPAPGQVPVPSGPPCDSPEECAQMFGPGNIPQ